MVKKEDNITPIELVSKIKKYKPYFKDNGGVTFSGGEPLLQKDFLIETCKLLRRENINIALDTAGVGIGGYDKILENVDLVLFDVKHTDGEAYKELTGQNNNISLKFIEALNRSNKKVWIRQVIIPEVTDNLEYLKTLKEFVKNIKNVEKVNFLPYHKLGDEKYIKLNIQNPYKDKIEMDKNKCEELYKLYINL